MCRLTSAARRTVTSLSILRCRARRAAAVAASALLAIILNPDSARRRQPLAPLRLAMAGVGLTLLSGLPAVVLGLPYLTHLWSGGWSTVLLFDLGVFCAVWGTLTGYLYPLLEADPR